MHVHKNNHKIANQNLTCNFVIIFIEIELLYTLSFLLGFTQVQSEGLVAILTKLGSGQRGQLNPKDLVSENINYYYYLLIILL